MTAVPVPTAPATSVEPRHADPSMLAVFRSALRAELR